MTNTTKQEKYKAWFDLARYVGVESMSDREVAEQLEFRQELLRISPKRARKRFKEIQRSGLVHIESEMPMDSRLKLVFGRTCEAMTGVMDAIDALLVALKLKTNGIACLRNPMDAYSMNAAFNDDGTINMVFDLNVEVDALLEKARYILLKERSRRNKRAPQKISESARKKIRTGHVLPILDLYIFSKLYGVPELTHGEYVEILGWSGKYCTEQFRQSRKGYALKFLERQWVDRLRANCIAYESVSLAANFSFSKIPSLSH
ncbi:DUF6387 family protein [Parendozoicomonas haliclonae]|uniref:Uncharacterized protein n=1 Tax=Parendozoicomonas haliclonae TaxID=1960125 RepID=A0A1X7AFM6_9GAMM|nr:DUF6387 family protein [Parendozoicomonas haliclonae]SMA36374.1 hypothetical protein EHSB41UT_00632 [Parendozoicomonas haliclonae]